MAAAKPNLRFQELRDEVVMTERWPHCGRSRPGPPSSAQLLRWHSALAQRLEKKQQID
jgi:hypothetical protein